MQKKQLFHVEHLGIMRDVVRKLFETDDQISLIQSQCSRNELMQHLMEGQADILLLGTFTPGEICNYPEICKNIRLQFPNIRIVVYLNSATAANVSQVMNAGAHAFVTNDMGLEDVSAAINAVQKNEKYLSKQIGTFFRNTFEFLAGLANTLVQKGGVFTLREMEVLELLASGSTTKEIADSLAISHKTVETHRKNLIHKAKVKNTAELIAYSHTLGIIAL